MAGIKSTQDVVRMILATNPKTRNSDNLLYVEVCSFLDPSTKFMQFGFVMENVKALDLPGFETVRRTRQKLQAAFPELAAYDAVSGYRALKEEEFRDYARSITV